MNTKKYMMLVVLSAGAFAASAQVASQVFRATIKGSRGTSGKCTIEVRVDQSAEVDVYGDSGRLRTISGQGDSWTRMECTDALPSSMSDFRFKGIDGRGNVKLVQDPRHNNGMAVIHIDDPRRGSEGYTFDLEWSGASGTATTGAFQSNPNYQSTDQSVSTTSGTQTYGGGRLSSARNISTERATELCRSEVRTRGERDYGLRNIDITSAGADTTSGRRNWITGTFSSQSGAYRRSSGYRFNCAVDYNSGQVQTVELLRSDGTALTTGTAATTYGQSSTSYDRSRVFRACQDAVVARTQRDGYQNVSFSSTAIDTGRSDRVVGTITASRGPVTDTFDFGCYLDLNAASVRNLEVNRR